jgi:uncharacterized protein (UPF0332 family)
MVEQEYPFLRKAIQSLVGAESEFQYRRYDNTANRCYYACFEAAIAALQRASIQPTGSKWEHDFLQGRFEGQLIYRRKLYPTELRGTLEHTYTVRAKGDYDEDFVTETEANRTLRRARIFVQTIQTAGGETR